MFKQGKMSDYIVLLDSVSGKYYVGRVQVNFDGLIEPCEKCSNLFDTVDEASKELSGYKE